MTVSKVINVTAPLTEDEIAEIAALDGRIPEPDEDSPEMTDEEIAFYDYLHRKYKTRRIDKEMIMKEMAYLLEIFHKRQEIL